MKHKALVNSLLSNVYISIIQKNSFVHFVKEKEFWILYSIYKFFTAIIKLSKHMYESSHFDHIENHMNHIFAQFEPILSHLVE